MCSERDATAPDTHLARIRADTQSQPVVLSIDSASRSLFNRIADETLTTQNADRRTMKAHPRSHSINISSCYTNMCVYWCWREEGKKICITVRQKTTVRNRCFFCLFACVSYLINCVAWNVYGQFRDYSTLTQRLSHSWKLDNTLTRTLKSCNHSNA